MTTYADIETLAMALYGQYSSKNKSTLQKIKLPLWGELGTSLRDGYRNAACELLVECAAHPKAQSIIAPKRMPNGDVIPVDTARDGG